jgi:hypothetical protein
MPTSFRKLVANLLAGCAILLLGAAPAAACNIPVFRYALEKWNADAYEVIVLHRGPLGPEEKALVNRLAKIAEADPPAVNITLEQLDLAEQPEDQVRELLAKLPGVELPALLVRYPAIARLNEPAWAGRLNADTVNNLFDSPARRELVRRLVHGDSAVWVLLESGDRNKDDAAAALLQAQLRKLEKGLKLPELTDDPEDKLSGNGPPLRLSFSHLPLARTDPAEAALVRLLLHSEPDLAAAPGPMIFPVFGRGRALYALAGSGITADNIAEAAAFLIGPCTCKVKEQNPGVDLLFSANWEALLAGHRLFKEKAAPPLASLAPLARANFQAAAAPAAQAPLPEREPVTPPHPRPAAPSAVPEVAEIVPGEAELPEDSGLVLLRNSLAGLLAGLFLVGAASLVLRGKRRNEVER